MKPEQEIIAKALKIAITLTGADENSIKTGEGNDLFINNRLYNTIKNVIRIINSKNLVKIVNDAGGWVYPDEGLNLRQTE